MKDFAKKVYEAVYASESDGLWVPRGTIYLIGNGGSAAIVSHVANDLVKARISAFALTDPAILTCLSNDYGYDYVFQKQLSAHSINTTLVAVSSSGKSKNILNAVNYAMDMGMNVITFTGFEPTNAVRKAGNINYWVPSHNYGVVECAHLCMLHAIVNP